MNLTPIPAYENKKVESLSTLNRSTLVVLDPHNDHIQVGNKKIYIDTIWNPEKNRPVSGHVLESCEGADHKRGDRVYFHYLAVDNAAKEGKKFSADDLMDTNLKNTVLFIPDDMLFLAVRNEEINSRLSGTTVDTIEEVVKINRNVYEKDGKVIMLNGFLLCEPVEPVEQKEEGNIKIPDHLKLDKSKDYARVVYKGNPREGEPDDVEEGDVIMLATSGAIPMEYGVNHRFMGGDKEWFRVPRKNIEGIVK